MRRWGIWIIASLLTLAVAGCEGGRTPTPLADGQPGPALRLDSGAFANGGEIPIEYSCWGENVSPALSWSGAPEGVASYVLTVTDPDAPKPDFVHWLVYGIPAQASELPYAMPNLDQLDDGTLQGVNDYGAVSIDAFASGTPIHGIGWDGPCPPEPHRYVFRLYALDALPQVPPAASLDEVTDAMQGHILATAELEGRFTPPP